VQASATEVRDVMDKGVAEAVMFPWGSVPLLGVDKVTQYHMEAAISTTMFQWLINQKVYDSMSPAQKKVIDDHCTPEWAEKVAGPWADFEHAGRDKIAAEAGHEVYKLTPEQMAAWKKAVAPGEAQWASDVKKAGGDPAAIMESLKANLKKYNAAL